MDETNDIDSVKSKCSQHKSNDPFPQIEPALLNSADIEDYVDVTGMIHPFDKNNLKAASYEAKIKGICKYWDDYGNEKEVLLDKPHKTFTLKPNSIAFVEVEPTFRLPDYIALRFNLKITHVYRGLLLGTGPLIDPGFEGKIYIPLHNLTSNEYVFQYGEGLIWIEFTKVSHNAKWTSSSQGSPERKGQYRSFPESKKGKDLSYFLNKAYKGGPIRSSIPKSIGEASESAKRAEKSVRTITAFGFVSGLGVIVSIFLLMFNVFNMFDKYNSDVQDLSNDVERLEEKVKEYERVLKEYSDGGNDN